MKNIIIRNVCLMALLFVVNSLWADIQLPNRAIGRPKIFTKSGQSWRWEKIAAERSWDINGYDNNIWVVYVDREGVKAYENPSSSSKVVKTLSFLEKHYVAKVQGDYALLFDSKYSIENLVIDHKNSTAIGWVLVDELLLWSECIRTRNQVYEKAVIVKDLEHLQGKKDLLDKASKKSYFRENPEGTIVTNDAVDDLEYFFVYKKVNVNNGSGSKKDISALLFLHSSIDGIDLKRDKKHGWMNAGLYTFWNSRLCYEPQFGEDVDESQKYFIFPEAKDLVKYLSEGNSNFYLWTDALMKERASADNPRYPVLDYYDDNSVKVGSIGELDYNIESGGNDKLRKRREAQKKVDYLRQQLGRMNIVFVLDGTSSMKNYYKPMAEAIKSSMRQDELSASIDEFKFGAVVYRNVADGEKEIERKQLTKDYNDVANWILNRETKSIGLTHTESMYKGIEDAIDNMNWSKENANFLILVGDAGNIIDKGKQNVIVQKLVEKNINFVAFQANHPSHEAYHEFASQSMSIMLHLLNYKFNRNFTKRDFDSNTGINNLRSIVVSDDELSLVTSVAYEYAEVGSSASPERLKNIIERRTIEFYKQATKNIDEFDRFINSIKDKKNPIDPNVLKKKYSYLTEEDMKILTGGGVYIKGYTSMYSYESERVFVPCVFMAADELSELIYNLESVTKNVVVDKRTELQVALIKLVLSYFGDDSANKTIGELFKIMVEAGSIAGGPLLDINIKDITDPHMVADEEIVEIIEELRISIDNLRRKQSDKSCYFEKNKKRYYYILAEDMPFFGGN